MKKNTSWKFTDELSVTFQSSVSGVGEFGHSLFQFLEFLSKGFVHMFYIVTTIYLIGHGLRFSRWIVAFFWASENKPTFFFRHIFQGQTKRRDQPPINNSTLNFSCMYANLSCIFTKELRQREL